MTTATFHAQPGIFARVAAFFTLIVEVIRESREMRATFGGRYEE